MKVTYTKNRFEIDGVEIINPEIMGVYECVVNDKIEGYRSKITSVLLRDGLIFDLPANLTYEVRNRDFNFTGSNPIKVIRLKLKEPLVHSIRCAAYTNEGLKKRGHIPGECNCKEPLVDTGSKETDFANEEFLLHLVDVVACFATEQNMFYATPIRKELIDKAKQTFTRK